ncbi:radical SAM/SPASM domain-containing protein [Candidatus Pelagibacter sp.]|uniref:radical SAM/SPASM domain-containing protein n=1 Tax=Candidatus Pelagibacter sp. TaxID=2024849 RepID=UPI003F86118D
MDDKILLNSTELTGIIGKSEIQKLSKVAEKEEWKKYRENYDLASNLNLLSYPIQLDFELNASCNLKCPMCPISVESPKGKGKNTWFDFDFFKKLIDYSVKKGTRAIKLNYINEPLIRNDIVKFIEYAKASGILDIYLSTNGILLKKDLAKKLIQSGLTRIQISIDAFTQDTYSKVRPGGELKKIIENVNDFLELKKTLNVQIPLLRVNFVKTELNEFELDQFISYWKDKVDMIGVQEFIKPTKVTTQIKSKKTVKRKNFKCSFPFKQLVINNEKQVLPCCTFWGEELALQKVEKPEDLLDAWNSPKMRDLRQKHLEGRYQEIHQCNNCIDGGTS